jgi:regulation of enolase protein 1 (concanavalin A-like superfamily)
VLLEASGVEEERLLRWVEEWLGARLVIEEPDRAATVRERYSFPSATVKERYRFHHALIREVVYGGVSRRRQGQLHERVGWALETVGGHDWEAPLEELARHFARTPSQAAREKGVEYCLRAGEKAQGLSTGAEAVEQFRGALRLLDSLPEDEAHWKLRYEVAVRLAQTHRDRLEWELARQVWEEYQARAERAGYPWGIASAHMEWAWQMSHESRLRGSGEIALGRRHAETSVALCEREGLADLMPKARWCLAWLLKSEPGSDLPRAAALLRQVLDSREGMDPGRAVQLAGVYARLGKWNESMAIVREIIAAGGGGSETRWSHNLYWSLALLEEPLEAQGRQAEFIAFCDDARRLLSQTGVADPLLAQWYLTPAEPGARFSQVAFQDDFEGPALREEWQWYDPLRVNAYRLGERAGRLTLRAAEGALGLTAPRLLLEVRGEFVLEARIEGNWDDRNRPGGSGLLVCLDSRNGLSLDKHSMDDLNYGSVGLFATIQGEFRTVGRGLLRGNAFHLRLEREGERFTALCSTDGTSWLTCGQVEFPARDPLLIGIHSHRGVVAHFDWLRVLTKP